MRDIVFVACFIAMIPAVFKRASTGVMLWIWVALMAPGGYLYGFAKSYSYNKYAVVVTFLGLFIDKTRRKPYFDLHVVLLLLFFVQISISYFLAIGDAGHNDDIYDRVTKIFLLAIVMISLVSNRLAIHGIILAICLGLGIHGTLEGLRYLGTGGGHAIDPPVVFGDNNYFAVALMMLIPLLWYLSTYSKQKIVQISTKIAVLINITTVVGSGSRGAMLGLGVVAASLVLQSKNKVPVLLAVCLVGGIGFSLTTDAWRARMTTINSAESDGSFMGRVAAWKMATVIAFDRPLIGGGFGVTGDPRVFDAYRSRFNTFSFFIDTGDMGAPLEAHSIYFQALGDTGFIGLGLFVGLLLTAFANLRTVGKLAKGRPDLAWAADLAAMMRLGLIAYSVSGALLSLAFFETYYVYITLISVLRDCVQREAKIAAVTMQPTVSRSRLLAQHATARVG